MEVEEIEQGKKREQIESSIRNPELISWGIWNWLDKQNSTAFPIGEFQWIPIVEFLILDTLVINSFTRLYILGYVYYSILCSNCGLYQISRFVF